MALMLVKDRAHFETPRNSMLPKRINSAVFRVAVFPRRNMPTGTLLHPTAVSQVTIRLPQLRHSRRRKIRPREAGLV
jgi:hypothetical protein